MCTSASQRLANRQQASIHSRTNQKIASAGNRTRAARVAGEHSTTEPPMLLGDGAFGVYLAFLGRGLTWFVRRHLARRCGPSGLGRRANSGLLSKWGPVGAHPSARHMWCVFPPERMSGRTKSTERHETRMEGCVSSGGSDKTVSTRSDW